MANVQDKCASIWHAVNTLHCQKKGFVQKSQLKVMSHNLGSTLGIENLHKSLEEYGSADVLSFEDFIFFLNKELFEPLVESDDCGVLSSESLKKIDEVCWMICGKHYLDREKKIIAEEDVYKLWRVFNTMAELNEDQLLKCPVVMDKEEVLMLHQKFLSYLGSSTQLDKPDEHNIDTQEFTFEQFLQVMEHGSEIEPTMASGAVADLYEEYVQEVLRKGNLQKKGNRMTNWKDRWFVLTPESLCYYTGQDMREKKGEMKVGKRSHVEPLAAAKHYRFQLNNGEGKCVEMTATDERTRTQWIIALKKAIDSMNQLQSPQKIASRVRRQQRRTRRQKEEQVQQERDLENERLQNMLRELRTGREESEAKRLELEAKYKEQAALTQAEQEGRASVERGRVELEAQFKNLAILIEEEKRARAEIEERFARQAKLTEAEQQARAEAVSKWTSEQALREQERLRLEELQEGYRQLEEMLDKERQLKSDEEIVRNLQARILQEEFEKTEHLEQLRAELEASLQEERQLREGLEGWKEQQQRRLDEEMEHLNRLRTEKEQKDQQLQDTQQKMKMTEMERDNLQERLKAKERMTPYQRLGQVIPAGQNTTPPSHRGLGFFPQFERGLSQDASPESTRSNSVELEDITSTNNNNVEKTVMEGTLGSSDIKEMVIEDVDS